MRWWTWAVLAVLGCGGPPEGVPGAEDAGQRALQAASQSLEGQRTAAQRAVRPAVQVEPRVVEHGPRDRKRVALTFDACSTRSVHQYDARITRTLVEMKAPATLFLGGAWAREQEAHVRELAANPLFELENHTDTHPHLTQVQDDARVLDELLRTQRTLQALTGRAPRFLRPPYGEYDARVARLAARAGLVTLEYDLPSGDPGASRERLVEWVLHKARPGSIIVMHVNHVSFHTAEALPDIIRGLRARGYELVTVEQLLADEAAPVKQAGGLTP